MIYDSQKDVNSSYWTRFCSKMSLLSCIILALSRLYPLHFVQQVDGRPEIILLKEVIKSLSPQIVVLEEVLDGAEGVVEERLHRPVLVLDHLALWCITRIFQMLFLGNKCFLITPDKLCASSG